MYANFVKKYNIDIITLPKNAVWVQSPLTLFPSPLWGEGNYLIPPETPSFLLIALCLVGSCPIYSSTGSMS